MAKDPFSKYCPKCSAKVKVYEKGKWSLELRPIVRCAECQQHLRLDILAPIGFTIGLVLGALGLALDLEDWWVSWLLLPVSLFGLLCGLASKLEPVDPRAFSKTRGW
ncbi:MAG: hypothetical protein JJ896_14265 [Rhodothermales bacterium]|nr:hypothetical protein [Rhodothermales bacterium]MBO6780814.1 hypothetical protein [Rhodothermales bacterium]